MDMDTNGNESLEKIDQSLDNMWDESLKQIKKINAREENWKIQTLPLARIKKIMKTEEFVLQELEKDRLKSQKMESNIDAGKSLPKFMISGEGPVLMSKACELLVKELTTRAWRHTEQNRRRTLQRQDIHAAVGESDMFDFLIDIVPRVANPSVRYDMPLPPPNLDPNQIPEFGNGGHDLPPQGYFQAYGQQHHMLPEHTDMDGHPGTPGRGPEHYV